jgi:hypothetical protein
MGKGDFVSANQAETNGSPTNEIVTICVCNLENSL